MWPADDGDTAVLPDGILLSFPDIFSITIGSGGFPEKAQVSRHRHSSPAMFLRFNVWRGKRFGCMAQEMSEYCWLRNNAILTFSLSGKLYLKLRGGTLQSLLLPWALWEFYLLQSKPPTPDKISRRLLQGGVSLNVCDLKLHLHYEYIIKEEMWQMLASVPELHMETAADIIWVW